MNKHNFKAVIFDLDGVITQTAKVHSRAWKEMFDEFLQAFSAQENVPFREFTHEGDYLPFVDGKPRYKGVASFLESRNINLPFGSPEDTPDMFTACGLGNRKNEKFNEIIATDGVEVFPSSVALIKQLQEEGIRIAVATSSKNCDAVLQATGLTGIFEAQIDGIYSAANNLSGKPDPDIFTTAADKIGVPYDQAIVVEDAVSGVMAGKRGNFGLVLGVAREENAEELEKNGADIVVEDLGDITLEDIDMWFEEGLAEDGWNITYQEYEPEKEKTREALLTVGNGFFGTRGAMEECLASEKHYPGTYVAGLYNRLTSKVGDRDIENEDFVNIPDWTSTTFRINDGEWFDPDTWKIEFFQRNLDMGSGEMTRDILATDSEGNTVLIESARFASMKNMHLGGLNYNITPMNFSGKITVKSGINGDIINDGVRRYRDLNQQHLESDLEQATDDALLVQVRTTQSDVNVAVAVRFPDNAPHRTEVGGGKAYAFWELNLDAEETWELEKMAAIYTSKENKDDFAAAAMSTVKEADSYFTGATESMLAWSEIWDAADMEIEGDREAQKLLRLHIYHLMCSFSPHNAKLDASITARGLHGEAYRGHIFWDELYILPWYCKTFPEAAKAMLMYRYRRLEKAREYANIHGFEGAMFPWQSGSDGREETQVVHLNPVSGKWGDDYSSLQRHVSLAVAYNVYTYFHLTNDVEFMNSYGLEMLLEISRFWVSKAKKDANDRYSIDGVMGPDEFHEKLPGDNKGGLRDNAYTNIMTAWLLEEIEALQNNEEIEFSKVCSTLKVTNQEIEKWADVAGKLNLVISEEGVISQFDGYFDLKELDWEDYRKRYGNIHRMDRILKSEGLSPDNFKVAKQADMLMTFYNLNNETVSRIINDLGYEVPEEYIDRNLDYYLGRTSHGSTLSRVVHAYLARIIGRNELSWELYLDALRSDFVDIQGGTTAEGIHAGVMAGTIEIAQKAFAGLDLRGEEIVFEPSMPKHWRKLNFSFKFRGERYEAVVEDGKASLNKLQLD
jgi:beta-phosphoglucomutase family hydrolase